MGVIVKSKLFGLAVASFLLGLTAYSQNAAASTYTYTFQGTGTGNFGVGGNETLTLGGTCPTGSCDINVGLAVLNASGPNYVAGTSNGWIGTFSASVSDGIDPTMKVSFVDGGGPGGSYESHYGQNLITSAIPVALNISASAFLTSTGGPTSFTYELMVSLPDGLFATPLPSSLPLMATGLGLAAAAWWACRRNRRPVRDALIANIA